MNRDYLYMSELNRSSKKTESSESRPKPEEHYPTEEELRAFEDLRRYELYIHPYPIPYMTIEEFARDPSNPTEDEFRAVEELNRSFGPTLTSFEEYFGYPDPRDKPETGQKDQAPPES
jgi:hypothetical protein